MPVKMKFQEGGTIESSHVGNYVLGKDPVA